MNAIETAKASLHATLVIRHPDDGKLMVNFDWEILQLIREAKCLVRTGIEIPEDSKMVILQEQKLKSYHNELTYLLKEYRRLQHMIRPIDVSPVEKVVTMLEDLQTQVVVEGKAEAKTYDKFACFCKDMTAEKTDAINTGTDKSADLSALIEQLTNDRSEADDDINELKKKIDEWTRA